MKNKILFGIVISLFILCFIFFIFFYQKYYKNSNIGNTKSNPSTEEIKEYILNMKTYQAEIKVTVKSNKNENKYVLLQKSDAKKEAMQEVLAPENMQGLTIKQKEDQIEIRNIKLNLTKIYQEYPMVANNQLFLTSFIRDFKQDKKAKIQEKEQEIILQTKSCDMTSDWNKKLFVDKKTGKPTKMEIKDAKQNTVVYILYTKIEINKLSEEDILAFCLNISDLQL